MLGAFDPHPATPGLDRLRRASTGYAGRAPATPDEHRSYAGPPRKLLCDREKFYATAKSSNFHARPRKVLCDREKFFATVKSSSDRENQSPKCLLVTKKAG